MKFYRYPKIENYHSIVEKTKLQPCANDEWVVMEKIHGSNLSFLTDGQTVKIARRSAILTEPEYQTFYRVGELFKDLMETVRQIHIDLQLTEQLIIYGELFGGIYPGCKANKWAKAVQSGIYYCPDVRFCAFDILVGEKYMNYNDAIVLFDKYSIFYSKPLFRGNLENCCKWSEEHYADITSIPEELCIGELIMNANFINKREGHVLKPVEHSYFKNGSNIGIKHKNDKFLEIQSKRKSLPLDEAFKKIEEYKDVLLSLINQQRLDNVVSKLGDIDVIKDDKRNIPKVIGLLVSDVLEDFPAEYYLMNESTQAIDKTSKKLMIKFIEITSKDLVLNMFK